VWTLAQKLAHAIDRMNETIGRATLWLVLVVVLIAAGNALWLYLFKNSSNAWLELQWVLFSALFLLCGGYTLLHAQHVRIDVVYSKFSRRTQLWIDIFGTIFFLFPMALFIAWLSWPIFVETFRSQEVSGNAGGLPVWPARLLVPIGFVLLALQGVSELIKRIAILRGLMPDIEQDNASNAAPIAEFQASPESENNKKT
jgi:TRAP-type mannitol/chloroaromatic compound transport system permease small subunit